MTRLTFESCSFGAVAAFYSLTHLSPNELPPLLQAISSWLRPGGPLVALLANSPDRGAVESDWLGVPMYFAGYAGEEGRRLVEEAGLTIVSAQPETDSEDGQMEPSVQHGRRR